MRINLKTIGVGEMVFSDNNEDILITYGLGSCVAITAYHPELKIGGLVHIALPSSAINEEKSKSKPGYFADTGVSEFFNRFSKLGKMIEKDDVDVKIIGGAMRINNNLEIGKRNLDAVIKFILANSYKIKSQDIGGGISRTVRLRIKDGEVTIKNTNLGSWKI